MNERDYLIRIGELITEKQYKIIKFKLCFTFILLSIICLGSLAVMCFSINRTMLIIGLIIFAFSILLIIFDVFYIINEYAAKIQLYRHYKKHPEDFDCEIPEDVLYKDLNGN